MYFKGFRCGQLYPVTSWAVICARFLASGVERERFKNSCGLGISFACYVLR